MLFLEKIPFIRKSYTVKQVIGGVLLPSLMLAGVILLLTPIFWATFNCISFLPSISYWQTIWFLVGVGCLILVIETAKMLWNVASNTILSLVTKYLAMRFTKKMAELRSQQEEEVANPAKHFTDVKYGGRNG